MTLRTRTHGTDLFLVLLCLAIALLVDQNVIPHEHFVSAPFAVAVLFAAYRWPTRGAIATAALAFGIAAYSAHLDVAPVVPALLGLLGLFLISLLAIFLGYERRVSARLAREAQEMLQQAQSARNTLRTVIDTLPAGVVVSDAHGNITLANVTAKATFGQKVTGNADGPVGGYTLLNREGALFPSHDLPLSRVIERGETSANVEIWVRREDGTERVILAGASPVCDEEGHVTEAVAVFQDVTERMEIEEALRTSQESLARAQEVAHLGNWDRDLRTGHLRWSDEVYRIFGITPQAFGGTLEAFLQRVHPDDQERVARAIQVASVEGDPYSLDHRIVRSDGCVRYVHEDARVLRDADGHPIHAVGTIQDITERKQVEEERERLLRQVQVERARVEAILSSTANAILFVDAASKQVHANPAAVQLFGHPFVPEEGQSQYRSQLLHPDERPVTLDELPSQWALQGRTTVHEELIVVRPQGERIPVLESAAAVRGPDGQVVGAVVVLQDISALKEIDRLREEWTSIIAHDLRQPVTIILGYASLLEMDVSAVTEWHREITHIIASTRNLSKMIEDLLDVSRIEARRLVLQLQPIDLPALVAAVAERTGVITAGHPVRLDVDGSVPPVLADPGRIEQVLGNLLSNAAKYGRPDSAIAVAVRQLDDTAVVSVTNHGTGIPPGETTQIFSRFYRTYKARTGRTAGLGLGLYISKGIVEAHQGRIWAESVPGQATTFSFTLPLEREGSSTFSSSSLAPSLEEEPVARFKEQGIL